MRRFTPGGSKILPFHHAACSYRGEDSQSASTMSYVLTSGIGTAVSEQDFFGSWNHFMITPNGIAGNYQVVTDRFVPPKP